ncbi:ABC-type sugar transport system ATPase component [Rubrobacter radiotolerans]|uniref:ABC-type sugar transport system ATPase component n=1 Tax=Rubrobacter radiotolerans TaxID=42256 RepID=A0A023X6P8_RUBRA|nr:sugar ABC transporter ATP-binding protein [Rubrobacter radiotolerans]AHY47744.1 ABC-type sugar transport system ATPase component [Rubrobacter radiotolerans]MDX5895220.1 sugar ABC transporter ATP-binding protein [Rubrobacter radiotolerans]SMC07671.1 ribose transport system ATP-binding protein [Rubrobacter radiotolerans DSM 5868]
MMHQDSGEGTTTLTDRISYRVEGLTKTFPGVEALKDVSMEVREGEIHGIVGKNGAGKSVLMSVLSGLLTATAGEMHIRGQAVDMRRYNTPRAHALGVELIPQEPTAAPDMSVQDNLFLGSGYAGKLGFVELGRLSEQVREVIDRLEISARPEWPIKYVSVEDQQLLAFGKALYVNNAQVILLDEITATLPRQRKTRFLQFLKAEVERKPELSFTLISHHIDEIMEFCDRVTVMRDGQAIGPLEVSDITKSELADLITGGTTVSVPGTRPTDESEEHPVVLSARNLTSPGNFRDVSFELRGGQVLGVAGLAESSGKDALLPALVGLAKVSEGEVHVGGEPLRGATPRKALKRGLVYLPKKREEEAVITEGSVQDNLLASIYERIRNLLGVIDSRKAREISLENIRGFGIKARSPNVRINTLSGGNRQKVMLARLMNTSPVALLLDEPTRGVDLGAKAEIMGLIRESLAERRAVIITSESEEELVELCDQILIINRGRLVRVLSREEENFSPQEVYRLVQGVGTSRSEAGSEDSA